MLKIELFDDIKVTNNNLDEAFPLLTLYAESHQRDKSSITELIELFTDACRMRKTALVKHIIETIGFTMQIHSNLEVIQLIGNIPPHEVDATAYASDIAEFLTSDNCSIHAQLIPTPVPFASETLEYLKNMANGEDEVRNISYRDRAPVMIFRVSNTLSFLVVLNSLEDGKRLMGKITELKDYKDKLLARTIFRYMLDKMKPTIIRSDNQLQIDDYKDSVDVARAIDNIIFKSADIKMVNHYMSIPRLIEQVNSFETYIREPVNV